jgi:hypothetical protein
MTFGRPFSIPESIVNLPLPELFPIKLSAGDGIVSDESVDVQFFVGTMYAFTHFYTSPTC